MKSYSLRNAGFFLALFGLLFFAISDQVSQAVPTKDTSTAGDWNTPGNWTPAGVPVSGTDSVNIDLSMSVSANTSFGSTTASDNSILDGGPTSVVTVNSGFTLEHVSGSTLEIFGANPFIAGAGTFLNSGTILNSSPRFLFLSGGTTLDNTGTFEFQGTNSKLVYFDLTTPQFVNNGNVNINMDNATDRAIIFHESAGYGGGQFVQEGNAITWTQGILAFAPPNVSGTGIGTSITDASFPLLFDTTSLNGGTPGTRQLRLGGGLDITLDSTVTDLTNVYLGDSAGSLYARPGGTTINVTGAGIRTAPATGGLINTKGAGDTITNLGTIVVANNGGQFFLDGNGTFINRGTINVEANRFLLGVSGTNTLQNEGDFVFLENNSRLDFWTGSDSFNNLPGGKVSIQLPNATDVARFGAEGRDSDQGHLGTYRNLGGSQIEFVKGIFTFAPPGGLDNQLNDAEFANLFGPINSDSFLRLGGGISDIALTGATDLSRVSLGDPSEHIHVPVSGTTLNVDTPTGIRTSDGIVQIEVVGGRQFTNEGTLVVSSGNQLYINGDGTLRNEGTMVVQSNRFLLGVTGSPTFDNAGTIQFTENNSRIDLWADSPSFNNLAGSLLQVNLPLGTNTSDIGTDSVATAGTFTNEGTIEILKGELVIESGIPNTPAVTGSGSTLATGTWRILADTDRSRLNFQAGSTNTGDGDLTNFDGSITSIGAGAQLVLSSVNGGSVEFPQLGSVANVDGELFVHGDLVLGVDSAMNVTGSLGGDGTIATAGSISLNGGILDPSSLSGGAGTLSINGDLLLSNTTELAFGLGTPGTVGSGINDLVNVNGDLVLDGVLDVSDLGGLGTGVYRLFNYTGSLTDNGVVLNNPFFVLDLSVAGQVNLSFVPEPSTGLLLLAGLVFFRRKRRK